MFVGVIELHDIYSSTLRERDICYRFEIRCECGSLMLVKIQESLSLLSCECFPLNTEQHGISLADGMFQINYLWIAYHS